MRERVLLGVLVALLIWATVGQLSARYGGPVFFFPPSVGLFVAPFRQAHDRTPDGRARTQVGCVGADGAFAFHDVDQFVLTRWAGSHHRKVALNTVLSDSMSRRSEAQMRRYTTHVLCRDRDLRMLWGCTGQGAIGLRDFTMDGAVALDFRWTCP
jgi:hypothetical protein